MGVTAWIHGYILIIVGSLEQTGRPGCIRFPSLIQEAPVEGDRFGARCAGGVELDRGQQIVHHGLDLTRQTLFDIPISIIVGAGQADTTDPLQRVCPQMTGTAPRYLNLQGMRVMAGDAGVIIVGKF